MGRKAALGPKGHSFASPASMAEQAANSEITLKFHSPNPQIAPNAPSGALEGSKAGKEFLNV